MKNIFIVAFISQKNYKNNYNIFIKILIRKIKYVNAVAYTEMYECIIRSCIKMIVVNDPWCNNIFFKLAYTDLLCKQRWKRVSVSTRKFSVTQKTKKTKTRADAPVLVLCFFCSRLFIRKFNNVKKSTTYSYDCRWWNNIRDQ